MFNFLDFYSLEYTRSDDTKFMILLSYQSGIVDEKRCRDVKYNSRFWVKFLTEPLVFDGEYLDFPK